MDIDEIGKVLVRSLMESGVTESDLRSILESDNKADFALRLKPYIALFAKEARSGKKAVS